ncbi:MAG TPA: ABC transporter permease subunit [Candidatus Hydrogenedentes bacterium]|nr:ABC transporter permease subunit [Candidatus Hydrogenedentota bacterium]
MTTLLDALHNAASLLISLDPDVMQYALRSLYIALVSTCLASIIGVPLGLVIAERSFAGKRAIVTVLNTLMGLPTVVVGLFVYSFISRHGIFGGLGWLFTVRGIIVGEVVLITPLVTAVTLAAVTRRDRAVRRASLSLGASETQALGDVFLESRFGILAAVIAGYGRVVGEVGVATILGGNADGFTRTLTTAIVLDTEMGFFARALALGIVLLALSLSINILFQFLQGGGRGQ